MTLAVEERQVRRYGWKPSLPDHRDLVADTSTLPILPEVDPRAELPIQDQGQLGSCTANAVGLAIHYNFQLDGVDIGGFPSRLDIYWGERTLEGSLGQGDTGAFGRDGFKWGHKIGVIPEQDWPYNINQFQTKPPADDVHRHKIGDYRAVPRAINHFKQVLSNKQTIAFGFSVFESFESQQIARTGVVPMPEPGERMLGGHEVLLVGYLKSEPHFGLCANSWSRQWGLGGFFLMPWSYLLTRSLSSDFRTIRRPLV